MKKATHTYTFTEGIGGGQKQSFLLLLNGGISKGYPKEAFTKEEAFKLASAEVNTMKEILGTKKVTFTSEI